MAPQEDDSSIAEEIDTLNCAPMEGAEEVGTLNCAPMEDHSNNAEEIGTLNCAPMEGQSVYAEETGSLNGVPTESQSMYAEQIDFSGIPADGQSTHAEQIGSFSGAEGQSTDAEHIGSLIGSPMVNRSTTAEPMSTLSGSPMLPRPSPRAVLFGGLHDAGSSSPSVPGRRLSGSFSARGPSINERSVTVFNMEEGDSTVASSTLGGSPIMSRSSPRTVLFGMSDGGSTPPAPGRGRAGNLSARRNSINERSAETFSMEDKDEHDDRRLVGKAVCVRGHCGSRPEINGVYATVRESWSGRVAYRNRVSQVYMIWVWSPPRWKIVPNLGSAETLAYVESADNEAALPFEVDGPWYIVKRSQEGALEEVEDPEVSCSFFGQTVVVSGRSGHNQRLNGVYEELPEAYGAYPAYADRQKHLFIYRRRDIAQWVISNRLGPILRAGRGVEFAQVEDDVPQPYLVRRPWMVNAWAGHPTELDRNISVFLKAETSKDTPPPVLTVRSKAFPVTEGTYTLQKGKLVNECVCYARTHYEGEKQKDKFLFWDGERWCISGSIDDRNKQCDSCSQKRDNFGHYHPDTAVWPGLEVLPGNAGIIGARLLASLRGRISSMSKHFN